MKCKCGEPCGVIDRVLRIDRIFKTYKCDAGHITKIIVDSGSEQITHPDGKTEINRHGKAFDIHEAFKRNWDKAYSKTY